MMLCPCCRRCGGLVLPGERIETEEGPCCLSRCVNCGDRVDPVIVAHRSWPVPPAPYPDAVLPVWDSEGAVLQLIQHRAAQRGEDHAREDR